MPERPSYGDTGPLLAESTRHNQAEYLSLWAGKAPEWHAALQQAVVRQRHAEIDDVLEALRSGGAVFASGTREERDTDADAPQFRSSTKADEERPKPSGVRKS